METHVTFTVSTGAKQWVDNITARIVESIRGVERALVHVSIPHTTAAIFLAEDDAELREDYIKIATETLAPLRPFKHIRKNNPNTEAHAFSSMLGGGVTLVVSNGALQLGTYQNVLFLEMDGPKERTVHVDLFAAT